MAKKRKSPAKPTPAASITPERFVRLYRLLRLLGAGPQTRAQLVRRLRVDVRGFYRDLELLRNAGVLVRLQTDGYQLQQAEDDALSLLPFPDPRLTLGAARTLAKGRTSAHRALADIIARTLPS